VGTAWGITVGAPLAIAFPKPEEAAFDTALSLWNNFHKNRK
jgi:hypothetical protein